MVTHRDVALQLKLLPKNDNTGVLEAAMCDVEEFSIIFAKKDSLAIYVICKEKDVPVFASIPGVTADRMENEFLKDMFCAPAIQLHMTNDCVFPLTVDAQPCQILQNASEMPDFVVGVSCRSRTPRYVATKAARILKKKENDRSEKMFLDDIKKKAKSHTFYLSNIFVSAGQKDIEFVLSSINFTYHNRQPNGLVLGKKDTVRNFVRTPRIPMFRKNILKKRYAVVLSPAELFSLFTLPKHSAGLEMESGRNKTGANVIPKIDVDPLDKYTQ